MNLLSVTAVLVLLFVAVSAGVLKKNDSSTAQLKKNSNANATLNAGKTTALKPIDAAKNKQAHTFRTARQIGYGAQGASLGSQLSGISSGYGYGYNNAVGMGGLGAAGGSNVGILPGLAFGRR